jgi:hypothetical protein
MVLRLGLILLSVALGVPASAGMVKGVCPVRPKPSAVTPEPSTPVAPIPGVHYVGTVTLLISLSNTGYVCEVQVLKGIDDAKNRQAIAALQDEIFQPILENGRASPGTMTVQRAFWRGDTSDFLMSQNVDATPDEITPDARAFHALDIQSVLKSGTLEDESYRNKYFGLSFITPGAAFTSPPLSEDENRNAWLIGAVVRGPKREDMYAISVLADGLSNYPQLKSRAQYLGGMRSQLLRDGAKQTRDDFPYLISHVNFVGTILRESDAPGIYHFRGLFSSIIKGYVLTLDISASTEDRVLATASAIKIDSHQ